MTLVDRLRDAASRMGYWDEHGWVETGQLANKSADRIEALEAALGGMLDAHHLLGVHENGEVESCRCDAWQPFGQGHYVTPEDARILGELVREAREGVQHKCDNTRKASKDKP